MYVPAHFRETDLARLDWLAAHDSFGTLVSMVDGAPFATHLPVLYSREGERVVLKGHWARPNPQWQTIGGQRALFMFHGPHTYISPRWYVEPARQVPTWNYATAHLYGTVEVFEDVEHLEQVVTALAAKYEAGAAQPWRLSESNPANLRSLRGIVGFELAADEIQVKYKLNQNHPPENVVGAIRGLQGTPGDDAATVAALMAEALARR
jgi:transcriptional regulator